MNENQEELSRIVNLFYSDSSFGIRLSFQLNNKNLSWVDEFDGDLEKVRIVKFKSPNENYIKVSLCCENTIKLGWTVYCKIKKNENDEKKPELGNIKIKDLERFLLSELIINEEL